MAYEDDERIPEREPTYEDPPAAASGDEWVRDPVQEPPPQEAPAQGEWERSPEQAPPPVAAAQDEWVRAPEQPPPPTAEPEAEGRFAATTREVLHSIIPGAVGAVGVGAGAAVGNLPGALIGGFAFGSAAERAQSWLLKKFGFDDEAQRAANVKAYPVETGVGTVLGTLPSFGVRTGLKTTEAAITRLASAGVGGGIDLAATGDPLHAAGVAVGSGVVAGRPTPLGMSAIRAGENIAARAGIEQPAASKLSTLLAEKVQERTNPNAETPTGATPEGAATRDVGIATDLHKRDVETPGQNTPGGFGGKEATAPNKEGIVSEPQNQPLKDGGNDGLFAKDKTGGIEGGQEPAPLGTLAPDVEAVLRKPPEAAPTAAGEARAPVEQAQQPPLTELVRAVRDREARNAAAAENPPAGSEIDAATQRALAAGQQASTLRGAPPGGPPGAPPSAPAGGPAASRLNAPPPLESAPKTYGAMFRRIFNPEWMSPASEKAAGEIRKGAGIFQGLNDKWTAQLEKHYPAIEKLDKFGMDALTDKLEGGNSPRFRGWNMPEEFDPLIADVKQMNKEYKEAIAKHADDPDAVRQWNEEHLPHLYKNPEAVKSLMERGEGGSGIRGSSGSLNARKFETYEQAREQAGHERAHANPLQALEAYRTELGKFLALRDAVQEMRASGNLKYAMPEGRVGASGQGEGLGKGERIHPDWEPVKELKSGGMQAYMPRDAATVFDNHLDAGLKKNKYTRPFYEVAREINNRGTGIELGTLNGFHFFVVGNEAMMSNQARGVSQLRAGDILGGGKSIGLSPLAPIMNYGKGLRDMTAITGGTPRLFGSTKLGELATTKNIPGMNRPFLKPAGELERSIVRAAQEAGVMPLGRSYAPDVNMSHADTYLKSYLRGSFGREMKEMAQRIKDNPLKEVPKAVWDQFGRTLQTMSEPLFGHFIPALKFGSLMENARAAVKQGGWDLRTPQGHEQLVRFMRKESNAIDARLGEMNINNSFMNKSLLHAGYVTLRSTSWVKGTITSLGGGVGGVAKALGSSIAKGDLLSKGGGLEKIANKLDMTHKDYDPNLTYAIAFPFGIALMGGLYQYIKSGELPSSMQDLYLPRTGGKVPGLAGQGDVEERVPLPGYHKEIRGAIEHPVQELTNKLNVGITTAKEQLTGRDYFNTPLVRPNATLEENLRDRTSHLKEKYTPLFIKGITAVPQEGSQLSKIERGMGFKPAAKAYTDRERTQQYLDQKYKEDWDKGMRRKYREEHGGRGKIPDSELRKSYGTAPKPPKSSTLVKPPPVVKDEWVRDPNQRP